MSSDDALPGPWAGPRRGDGARFAWAMAMHDKHEEHARRHDRGHGHDMHDKHEHRRGRGRERMEGFWMSETEDGRDQGRGEGRGRGSRGGRDRGPGFGPGGFGPEAFGPGFGPGFGAGFGPGGPFGHRGRRGGGRRAGRGGRGDVRAAILLLLSEQPMHGYELIQQIVDRSGGVWTPSPGSVYPALSQLEDEGLIRFERVEGRKTASLTEEGTTYVDAHRDELGAPWDDVSGGVNNQTRDMFSVVGGLMGAVKQVAQVSTPAQHARAVEVLTEARRSLYRILAEDGDTGTASDEAAATE